MIRTRGLIAKSAAYESPELKDPALVEPVWQEWAVCESLKRCVNVFSDKLCIFHDFPSSQGSDLSLDPRLLSSHILRSSGVFHYQ
jgi:hypothetical protein